MASYGEIPRGLADLKVAVLAADVAGTSIDVPGIRSLTYNVESDTDELEGDNAIIAVVRNPKKVTGSIELGQMNLAALAALIGGTATTSGSNPNRIITYSESDSSLAQYVQITGQAPAQDATGAAYRVVLKKCLVTSGPDESLTVNEWSTPSLDFEGIAISGVLLIRSNYETLVPLT